MTQREDAVMISQLPSLRDYIKLHVLTVGRRLMAMRQTLALATERDESDALKNQILALIEYDEGLVGRENLWRQQQKVKTRPDAKKIDPLVDRQLGAVFTTAESYFAGLDPAADGPLIKQGQDMLASLFPKGVGAVVHLPYEDELEVTRHILRALNGTWQALVAEIGLTKQVARLQTLTDEYAAALGQLPKHMVDFKTLRAERWLGHELMLGVVVKILGSYHAPNAAAIDNREALMRPIQAQNRRIADYMKRRQRISDVNPETGEELEPDDLTEPLDTEETSA